jgi:hypothetical protein
MTSRVTGSDKGLCSMEFAISTFANPENCVPGLRFRNRNLLITKPVSQPTHPRRSATWWGMKSDFIMRSYQLTRASAKCEQNLFREWKRRPYLVTGPEEHEDGMSRWNCYLGDHSMPVSEYCLKTGHWHFLPRRSQPDIHNHSVRYNLYHGHSKHVVYPFTSIHSYKM